VIQTGPGANLAPFLTAIGAKVDGLRSWPLFPISCRR